MNERIKLPAQEWLGYDPEKGDIHGYTFDQMREFAELIVRECADLLMQAAEELEDQSPNKGYFEIAADLSETIKNHFGVQ